MLSTNEISNIVYEYKWGIIIHNIFYTKPFISNYSLFTKISMQTEMA